MTWGLAGLVGWLFWLRGGGERYRGVEQVEGAALVGGGVGEHGHVGAGAVVADLVAVRVARWSSRPRKLRSGWPSASWLRGGCGSASGERCADATGLSRWRGCSPGRVI